MINCHIALCHFLAWPFEIINGNDILFITYEEFLTNPSFHAFSVTFSLLNELRKDSRTFFLAYQRCKRWKDGKVEIWNWIRSSEMRWIRISGYILASGVKWSMIQEEERREIISDVSAHCLTQWKAISVIRPFRALTHSTREFLHVFLSFPSHTTILSFRKQTTIATIHRNKLYCETGVKEKNTQSSVARWKGKEGRGRKETKDSCCFGKETIDIDAEQRREGEEAGEWSGVRRCCAWFHFPTITAQWPAARPAAESNIPRGCELHEWAVVITFTA